MKKKAAKRVVTRKSSSIRHAHPKHLGQMETLLLLVVILVLLGMVGSLTGILPSFWNYPKVLSAMVGR